MHMKKLLFSLVAMMIATVSFAQNMQVATLSNGGNTSIFYGASALIQALGAANNGDVITLSSGRFTSTDITKAVSLRGAGMLAYSDSVKSYDATVIQGELKIEIASDVQERLMLEGIFFDSKITYKGSLNNPIFMKTRFQSIEPATTETETTAVATATLTNGLFIHCRVASGFTLANISNAVLMNSVVWNPYNSVATESNFEFDNCVVTFQYPGTAARVINSYYKNCVIMVNGYAGDSMREGCIPSSSIAVNCIGHSSIDYGKNGYYGYSNIFYDISSNNTTNSNINVGSAFKAGEFIYKDEYKYELTDDTKANYHGNDGTEVGIYGGNLPYSEEPSTQQIVNLNVAEKSTTDGKLSIDIVVKGNE